MKKNTTIVLLFLALGIRASAQDYYVPSANANRTNTPRKSNDTISVKSLPVAYLGLGTGVNSYCGFLGAGIDIRLYQTLFLRGGVGFGTWGNKISVGLKYAEKYTSGWIFGLQYIYCTGISNFTSQLQVDSGGGTVTKNVNLTLEPTSCINITASYAWVYHRKNNFFLEFGYSVPLATNPYTVNDGSVLTSVSTAAMKILEPGGFVVACGIMFGL